MNGKEIQNRGVMERERHWGRERRERRSDREMESALARGVFMSGCCRHSGTPPKRKPSLIQSAREERAAV